MTFAATNSQSCEYTSPQSTLRIFPIHHPERNLVLVSHYPSCLLHPSALNNYRSTSVSIDYASSLGFAQICPPSLGSLLGVD